MLRQGTLGNPRPGTPQPESHESLEPVSASSDANNSNTYLSADQHPIDDQEVSQDLNEDDVTFVYENNNLDIFPTELCETILQQKNLQKLSLKGNKLNAIPERLGQLRNLYYLNLSYNNFTEVPNCIAELQNLEVLDMSSNNLRALPSFLSNLPQLLGLSLVANNFEVFPPIIADLPKLVILEMEDNPLRIPAQLPRIEDAEDDDSWMRRIREYINEHRTELELALKPHSSTKNPSQAEDKYRIAPERLRSASESGISLRAAKRMGFVMSRNATDQSYVANLHARGLSHDANMIDATSSFKPQQTHSEPYSAGSPSLNYLPSKPSAQFPHSDVHGHGRSLSSFAVLSEHNELQPPPPRSPSSRSPFASPWGSPRPSITEAEPQGSISSRLSTLAEEHDADSEAGETEADSSFGASREPSYTSSDIMATSQSRRFSNSMPPLPETHYEDLNDVDRINDEPHLSSSQQILFKDSYNEPAAKPQVGTYTSAATSSTPIEASQRKNSSASTIPTPISSTSSAIESVGFVLDRMSELLKSIADSLPPVIIMHLRDTQELMLNRQWARALTTFAMLLDKFTSPINFPQIISRLSRRQQRQFVMTIMISFPELESAWRHIQRTRILPISIDSTSHHQPWAQDEQLHVQLDHATKGTQSVLAILNSVVAKSAVAAADGPEPSTEMASCVRDLSSVCIRCSSATRSVRLLLDREAAAHARTLQISERRRFWEEVNMFLKAVISTLAAVKAALPVLPLLADSRVGSEVAKLSRVAKEIPPLLEQSSYRVLLDAAGSLNENTFDLPTPSTIQGLLASSMPSIGSPTIPLQHQHQHQHQHQYQQLGQHPTPLNIQHITGLQQASGMSQVSLPPPTPLTASLGAAAQALISPNERVDRADGYIQYGTNSIWDSQQQ